MPANTSYISNLTTDYQGHVRAHRDFAVDGTLTVETFSANTFAGNLSGNSLTAQSGSTMRVANGFDLIAKSIDSGGQVYNVRAFGAAGDGATNDRAAIQLALDAANKIGGTAFFPQGTYQLGGQLICRSATKIVCEPGARFTISSAYTNTSIFAYSSRTDVEIDGIEIDCSGLGGAIQQAFFVSGCTGFRLKNAKISGSTRANAACISVAGGYDTVIEDGEFYSFPRGIFVSDSAVNVKIKRNRIHDVTERGMYFLGTATDSLSDVDVEGNKIWGLAAGADYPIYFTTGGQTKFHTNVRVVGNRISGNTVSFVGGSGTADGIAVYSCQDFVVQENFMFYGGDCGIATDNAQRGSITGNVSAHNHTDGIATFRSRNINITGNVCYNNYQDYGAVLSHTIARGGIRFLSGSTDCHSTGNICFDAGAATQEFGVVFNSGSTRCSSIGDKLDGNTVSAYSNQGTNCLVVFASNSTLSIAGSLMVGGTLASQSLISSAGVFVSGGGAQGAPAYTFSGDTDTGFYRSGGNIFSAVADGQVIASFRSLGGAGQLAVGSGFQAGPSFAFASELSLGVYRAGAGTIALASGGNSGATLQLNQGRLLSMRTLAASAITVSAGNTNLRANEAVFTIGGASGASFAIHSGGTVYIFESSKSAAIA
jgi:hypothetical protein